MPNKYNKYNTNTNIANIDDNGNSNSSGDNGNNGNNIIDVGILAINRIKNMPSLKYELDYYQMATIAKTLLTSYILIEHPPALHIWYILLIIITNINKQILIHKYYTPYHPYTLLQIISFNIITPPPELNINIIVGRGKYQNFTIQFNILSSNTNMAILTASIIGIINNDSSGGTSNSNGAILYNETKNGTSNKKSNGGGCFGVAGSNNIKLDYSDDMLCQSYHDDIEQNGIWDEPCTNNIECPFYNKNNNYPNNFGNCDISTGYCNMPLGVIPIGYKQYIGTPYCYGSNMCVASNPDYAFPDDIKVRRQYQTSHNINADYSLHY